MKRSAPGILVFDTEGTLLYTNAEVLDLLPAIGEAAHHGGTAFPAVPVEVLDLVRGLHEDPVRRCVVVQGPGNHCALRAFPIGHDVRRQEPTHIVVMVESIAETHDPDFSKAKIEFELSNREVDVLKCICSGLGNRAISEELSISEYTVKDHIKSIMRKMKVSSRNGMISRLK